ncbi:MAG TPA: nucleoside-diphosphate sugar epimerase/dehydratase, partial [Flavitalea sp.]|nr:nucleoside-diphosphate sugar epimerase/dehydratase [Flavitalea sp.]
LYAIVALAVFYGMGIHTGLIRYSNTHDMFRIFSAVSVISISYPVVTYLVAFKVYSIDSLNITGVLLVNFFIASSLLIMLRTGVKGLYYYMQRITTNSKVRVLIYGSDNNAILVKKALQSSSKDNFVIVGFIDSDKNKVNSYIEQIRVYHFKDLQKLKEKRNVERLILMNEQLGSAEKQSVIEKCLTTGVKVLTVPPSEQWIYGRLSLKQIQDLKIEDLLQRDPIVINNSQISGQLTGRRILITGAAGSIGSEIVRQVLSFRPEMVILCDQSESALHEIQLEMEEKFPKATIKTFIGSIREINRMQIPFTEYKPQMVFHAAAYKHVPMMEHHPSEAILTNVLGTKNMADLAVFHHVEKFVMISTDKAVNPTNVMGSSKRIAEMYVQSLNNATDLMLADTMLDLVPTNGKHVIGNMRSTRTKFITTRFGNVLDSNGSVIPRFRGQIQKGGPVTVTHPDITRYFMTIPEAVQLVLEAGTMGNGGEIFIFDMGSPVRITDLALKMIKLAGLTPGKDIEIIYTGLRPGEKLYEELLNEAETTIPTHHEKIKIAKVRPCSFEEISSDIEELELLAKQDDNYLLVGKMKAIVPEFLSKNSLYEELDYVEVPQQEDKKFKVV